MKSRSGNTVERVFKLGPKAPKLVSNRIGELQPKGDKEKRLHALIGGWPWFCKPLILPDDGDAVFWSASAGGHADLVGLTRSGSVVAAEFKQKRESIHPKNHQNSKTANKAILQALHGLYRAHEWQQDHPPRPLFCPWPRAANTTQTIVFAWDMADEKAPEHRALFQTFRAYVTNPNDRNWKVPKGKDYSHVRDFIAQTTAPTRLITATVGVLNDPLRVLSAVHDFGAVGGRRKRRR